MDLVLAARNAAGLNSVAHEITSLGVKAIPVPTDITDLNALKNLVTTAKAELGGIDVLVNNAAVDSPIFFHQERLEVIEQIMATNLTAPMLLTQLVLPGMI